jgi:hypothetical protein
MVHERRYLLCRSDLPKFCRVAEGRKGGRWEPHCKECGTTFLYRWARCSGPKYLDGSKGSSDSLARLAGEPIGAHPIPNGGNPVR